MTELAFERRADAGDPIAYARQTLRDPSRASWEAGHVGEWWNGGGGPAGLRGAVTPITSRIVAVADTWSALTAKGGPELSHADALVELENAAGTRFDPRVVQAAYAVVAEERVSENEPAPVPRLHALRVPAPLRRALAAPSADRVADGRRAAPHDALRADRGVDLAVAVAPPTRARSGRPRRASRRARVSPRRALQ